MADIRVATTDDIPLLIELGREMHAESPRYGKYPFNPTRCESLLLGLIPSGGVFVAEDDGLLVGMMLGYSTPFFFGPAAIAGEFALYVLPARRGGMMAVRLIEAFEHWAKAQGVDEIVLAVSTEIHTERTAELYERLGYRRVSISLVKEIKR